VYTIFGPLCISKTRFGLFDWV